MLLAKSLDRPEIVRFRRRDVHIAAAGNPWFAQMNQPGVVKFDRRTETAAAERRRVDAALHEDTAARLETLAAGRRKILLVEPQPGRGRIAVTSFRLGQSSLLNWPSFDCFLNAVLLRRLPRDLPSDR